MKETAAEILNRTAAKYTDCRSYSDAGKLHSCPDLNNIVEFQTVYANPNQFRFQWLTPTSKDKGDGLIWSNESGAFGRFAFSDQTTTFDNIQSAIWATAGLSFGASSTVPSMLIPGAQATNLFLALRDIEHVAIDKVLGDECHHIVGTSQNVKDTELWISRETHTIRRVKRHSFLSTDILAESIAELRALVQKNARLPERAYKALREIIPSAPDLSLVFTTLRKMIKDLPDVRLDVDRLTFDCLYSAVEFDVDIPEPVFHPM